MVTCQTCGYDKNPKGAEFCDACGSELTSPAEATAEPLTLTQIQPIEPPQPIEPSPPIQTTPPFTSATTARLISKQADAPTPEFKLDDSNVIGLFDPDMGPVDIDLETFLGNETVSRHHAEIYREGGVWKIKDLGSTNGVFIKPVGQTRFNAKITRPETINSGDEIAIAKIRFLFQSP